jgi:4-hydroxy-3-methylbut-2-en-1-yl diphosphate reductase
MVRRRIDTRLPCKDGPPGLFPWDVDRVSVQLLGDANRGAHSWPFVAVSTHEKPAATTPRSSGLLCFLVSDMLLVSDTLSNRQGNPNRCQTPVPAGDRGRELNGRQTRGYDEFVVRKVLLASPRGYCAGVERAVDTVEKALELYGPPVYVRKQIVHNLHVVRDLEARGAVFVDEETEVPEGATVVFSAHGVAPSVHTNAAARRLNTIDATCPLVTKVHVQARRYAADGYTVLLIGHEGHEEVVGTMGEAPDSIVLVESVADAEALSFPAGTRLAYVTQTTLSVDETGEIITALRRRFPDIHAPKKEDICYATSNRQWAVKEMLGEIQLLLVIGSRNSSNSNRLVEVARANGVASHLIDDETEIHESWVEGIDVVGVTSGASAPEKLVDRVCDWFRARGTTEIEPYRLVDEDVEFRLPVELRRELALADAQR